MALKITAKEKGFLLSFSRLRKSLGHNPNKSELARDLGYKSPNSIRQFMDTLNRKGIDYKKVEPVGGPIAKKQLESTHLIPIVGNVACGTPALAEENIEDYLEIDSNLIKDLPNKYFILRARGNSMDKAGIEEGDFVFVKSQSTASPGDRVVALIDNEATIKIYKPSRDFIMLLPKSSDPSYKPIILDKDFLIQGVVKHVFKKEFFEN